MPNAVIRTPLGRDINGDFQATELTKFACVVEVIGTDGDLLDLTPYTPSARGYAPKDGTNPTVTVTKQANQTTTGKGKIDLVIAAAELTTARIDGENWEIDLLLDDGGGAVPFRYATLQVNKSNAA